MTYYILASASRDRFAPFGLAFGEVSLPSLGEFPLALAAPSSVNQRGVSPARPPHTRFKQLVKKVGPEKAEAMLQTAEQGFKENYALLKKLSEM